MFCLQYSQRNTGHYSESGRPPDTCERVSSIQICYVGTRIFLNRNKNYPDSKYQDTCWRGLNVLYMLLYTASRLSMHRAFKLDIKHFTEGSSSVYELLVVSLRKPLAENGTTGTWLNKQYALKHHVTKYFRRKSTSLSWFSWNSTPGIRKQVWHQSNRYLMSASYMYVT